MPGIKKMSGRDKPYRTILIYEDQFLIQSRVLLLDEF